MSIYFPMAGKTEAWPGGHGPVSDFGDVPSLWQPSVTLPNTAQARLTMPSLMPPCHKPYYPSLPGMSACGKGPVWLRRSRLRALRRTRQQRHQRLSRGLGSGLRVQACLSPNPTPVTPAPFPSAKSPLILILTSETPLSPPWPRPPAGVVSTPSPPVPASVCPASTPNGSQRYSSRDMAVALGTVAQSLPSPYTPSSGTTSSLVSVCPAASGPAHPGLVLHRLVSAGFRPTIRAPAGQ